MAATWRTAALEQAELVSDRLRQLASSGLHFLHNEFGLDLGVDPELWPTWVILAAALIGLLVALWWVVACGGAARRKRGTGARDRSIGVNVGVSVAATDNTDKPPPTKAVKTEEPKKKNKKKTGEKQKTQPNGRTVPEPREGIKVSQEIPKQAAPPPPAPPAPAPPPPPPPQQQQPQQPPPDCKADKAKKSKKKPKTEVKQGQSVSTTDGKEPDEGTWETKISNREKRQQRRKEKGPSDESGSPGGGNPVGQQTEQPVATAPVSSKRNKESLNLKSEKRDAIITPAPPSWNPASSVNSGGWAEVSMKLPSKVSAADSDKWSVGLKTTGHRNSEPLAWGQESEGSWTGIDGRIKTELNTVNFSVLGLKSSAADPAAQSAADLGKWDNFTAVNNEWSGINGLGAVDSGSDWNAPTELWGNYEEPNAERPAAQEAPISQPPRLQDSDDDKEKGDPSASGKSKRKKKKKKKPEDENAVSQVKTEGLPAPSESSAIKPRPHVPQEEPAKQNVMPPASQKKTDQNWEPPKQVQKKKARRET